MRGEEIYCLVYGHLKDIVNILILEFHLKDISLETLSATFFAREHEVGHELHLHFHLPLSLTRFAASAVGVERKMRRREVHLPGERLGCHEFAYLVVGLHVSNGIGARGFADRVLIYKLHGFYIFQIA